ncbi:beta-ketoacyl synthase chain length factor [Methylicorpusculum oleiharenae]|uniref:beta-ketoacyl-[acyl-carrier-protein] synthase family protein n=1 Tax=Methylicorpusculum oleiharenae TaxID=1338687 RepID=UPI0013567C43|nr:beta-ketoacyl synthase N-terminal-like domain-containing protein [Methylicorpusculum oleiharenae]MCD2451462.1 beta-ketoacyl synthase chain length factor [Methylicorpusculum oleiharenae]
MTEAIVVSGIGIISPLGSNCSSAVQALQTRKTGIEKIHDFESGQFHGSVKDFNVEDYINPREARKMDPISCYTIAAGNQALEQAGLTIEDRKDCGLLVGTGFSGLKSVVEHQKKFLRDGITTLSPFHFPNTVYNASAGLAAIKLGIAGPNSTVTGVDVSGEQAIQYAVMMLHQGMAERVLVIGVDELSTALIKGFSDMRLLDQNADAPACPFSRSRSGFNLSEGCAALLLETEASARSRSAKSLAKIEGIGLCAAASDSYEFDRSGHYARTAIEQALQRAEQPLSAIDWISSAANGSKALDAADMNLWPALLADSSAKITALKAFTGEFAGSGVLRLALGIASMLQGFIPAMAPDKDYDENIAPYLNFDVSAAPAQRFLHQGSGIGGSQVAMIVNCRPAA